MELFNNAKAVRLRSHHDKYLHAEDDEESISQHRGGSSKNARWTVEFVSGDGDGESFIRLKSCYGKYLTASNQPFLLGMTGRKVIQTLPRRIDSSVEWEPVRDGDQVRLKTRYGHFLRANGGLPPWRNSVTHDVPHRTATQDWISWEVQVVEILAHSPVPKPAPPVVPVPDSTSFASEYSTPDSTSFASEYSTPDSTSFASESTLPSYHTADSTSYSRQESSDSLSLPPKFVDGRTIYFHIADENDDVDEGFEELCITFKGNGVEELTHKLEEETGLKDITVCSRSPLNGKLFPLRLQLPPNNVTMHVVVLQSHDQK